MKLITSVGREVCLPPGRSASGAAVGPEVYLRPGNRWLAWLIVALSWASPAYTETPDAAPDPIVAATANSVYLSLGPSFVTNYDGGARLKYLKSDVSVRVHADLEDVITYHLPYIRNRLVVLFSAQLEEGLNSTQGREALRRQSLEQIRQALRVLESDAHANQVIDVYFTSFVVQR